MAKKVRTPEFRVSFPNVFTPKAFTEGMKPKYSVTMLFPEGTDLSELKALHDEVLSEKWPDPKKRPANLRSPFRDGSEKPDTDGYEGTVFVNASSLQRPQIVDRDLTPILDEESFYPGCYALATVTAYAYDKAGNRGVAFGLQNLQKVRDGESFTGRSRAEDDFEKLDEIREDDDMFS